MKAILYEKYGSADVLQLKEVAKPAPQKNELLVKVQATTVSAGDVKMRSLDLPPIQRFLARLYLGFNKPKRPILGMELAGEVAAVGPDVRHFQEGDQVFASLFPAKEAFGGYAEYKCLPEDGLVAHKPANMNYEEAAAVPSSGLTTLGILKKARIQDGQKVLIYGASGSVGTYAVQLARHYGAQVTGVCSGANLAMVRSLGAAEVIDYNEEDFSQGTESYDVIFDAVDKLPAAQAKKVLKKTGIYLNVDKDSDGLKINTQDLITLKELIEAGAVKAVIDRCYPLAETAEAHRYVEKGHKKGNVVITIGHDGQ